MSDSWPRQALPPRLHGRVVDLSDQRQLDPADLIELTLTAEFPDPTISGEAEAVRTLLDRIKNGEVTPLENALAPIRDLSVLIVRMGSLRGHVTHARMEPDTPFTNRYKLPADRYPNGFGQRWIGMSVADGPLQTWHAARGYSRTSHRADYLVPTRYGHVSHLYRVTRWNRLDRNKIWAAEGHLIHPGKGTVTPITGGSTAPRLGQSSPATADDLAVASALSGKILALGRRTTNPVIPLRP